VTTTVTREEAKAAVTAQAWTEEPSAEGELAWLRKACDDHIARLREVNTWAEFTAAGQDLIAAIQPTPGRRGIHRFGSGGLGADIDLDVVLRDLDAATRIEWVDGFLDHDLMYEEPDGTRWLLAVKRPDITGDVS
jgi:hypothetical protein